MNALAHPSLPPEARSTPTELESLALLRLIQLASPTLPIGAYAYSQGLEAAVEQGSVSSEADAVKWIGGVLEHGLRALDLPVLARLYAAWQAEDENLVQRWSQFLCASRESRELLLEEEQLGESLRKLLCELGASLAEARRVRATYLGYFALGAVHFRVPLTPALSGYCFAWAEHQVSAASRLIPLGPMASQRLLSQILSLVPRTIERALTLADEGIGVTLPRQAIGSALHETQYTRIFRS
ncbi:MAG: urease accessory UreF family protein [Polyangiaceae bacterium]|nr:urease accessory UreF family protein [Polyangiaceae bacterium]